MFWKDPFWKYSTIPLLFLWPVCGFLCGFRIAELLAIPVGGYLGALLLPIPWAMKNYSPRVVNYWTGRDALAGGAAAWAICSSVIDPSRPVISSLQAVPTTVRQGEKLRLKATGVYFRGGESVFHYCIGSSKRQKVVFDEQNIPGNYRSQRRISEIIGPTEDWVVSIDTSQLAEGRHRFEAYAYTEIKDAIGFGPGHASKQSEFVSVEVQVLSSKVVR